MLQRSEILRLYPLQSLVTFLLMNDVFASSLSLTLALPSEICGDPYQGAAVRDSKTAQSKYPARVIWHSSMEITEAMNASPGTGSNSEYLCIWIFFRNIVSFLNTSLTQLWFKNYFDFSCLPKSLKGTCHVVGKELLNNFTLKDCFIYKLWRAKNSCVGRGEWPFYPGPAFDSCDFMSCGQNQETGRSNFSCC